MLKYSSGVLYNIGLLVWYVDFSFIDNWVGLYLGEGFLGVVDFYLEVIVGILNGKLIVKNSI